MSSKNAQTYAETFGEKFQNHILAVAVRHPSFVLRYRSVLNHEYFVSDLNRAIAKALFSHVDEFRRIPTHPTLIEELRPKMDENTFDQACRVLEKFYDTDISDANAVMKKTVDFGKTQAMCNAVVEGAERIEKGKRHEVMQLIRDASVVGEDLLSIGTDYAGSIAERALWYSNPEENVDAISTGIWHLDLAMGGGLGRGELGCILGPPKRGKSTMLINLGFGALISPLRQNVVHYTAEMSEKKVTMRYDDRLAGIIIKEKRSEPLKYAEGLVQRIKKFIRGRLFVKGYDTRAATVSTLRSHLSLLSAQGFHPDVIIVDYADILKPERRLGEMRHEQAGIYEDLRALAGEYDAALWTGSQASKGALEKETITIADFAEAFEKAAIVDAAIAFSQTQDEFVDRKCRLFMAALRNQEGGSTVECSINRERCMIKSLQLLDSSSIPQGTSDDDEATPSVKTVTHVHGPHDPVANRLKVGAGIKKPPMRKGPFKKNHSHGPSKKLNL